MYLKTDLLTVVTVFQVSLCLGLCALIYSNLLLIVIL